MKLSLPDVTLLMIETREHELARLAIEECTRQVDFAEVLILTDRPQAFDRNARIHSVPDWPDKVGWARAAWFTVPPLLRTSHMLCIQWDSWILDVSRWRDEWLRYDYIGAPWPFHRNRRVGNSGFSLKSTRLARYIRDRRDKYPCDTWVEDDLLCRKYRHGLEESGFVWAPETVAAEFSFECEEPRLAFGFHSPFHFGAVLEHDRLIERARLMFESQTISQPVMRSFCQKHPDMVKELLMEDNGVSLVANKGD